jgi:hypothetical protein
MLPEVSKSINHTVASMGEESTDQSDDDKKKKELSKEIKEGEKHATEFTSLPNCN